MEIKQIQQRHEAACQVVNELCSGDRKWLMSIPARPEYDPDLLISASLNDIPALLEKIKKLELDYANKCIECGEAQEQAADLRWRLDELSI